MIREVRREWGGCSSWRVQVWWMLTMNSHGIEISIAGCVEEMVRDRNPTPVFQNVLFFKIVFMCFVLNNYREQRLHAALAMVKKEPHPLFFSNPAPGKKPSTQVSLV